jgi:3-methylcrotonyl-CoA carboxylase alpha subunit
MPDELSPTEVAKRLGTSTRTVQRWIADGRLPARRLGGRWRVAIGALDAFASAALAKPPDGRRDAPAPPGHPRAETSIRAIFVANRGEVAARIRRSADRLGMTTLVPGEADVPMVDLLDINGVVRAALAAGADALHPGYGFLSENATFAEAVEAAGIRWIGPPPEAIRAMGDKAAARRLAASLGVPVVPGYDDADESETALRAAATRIGTPLLVKPAAGGGGKGMRILRDLSRLDDAVASARREAIAAFGDDRVILERYLEGPRHVEIQVLFDAHGSGVHLGERDCSIQRRHQKVLEESPSPAVTASLRAQIGHAALTLAGAVGYRSAGTCEFLVDDHGQFFFLEMNTRLQVEHPVTELVTGRDLVADQIRIAEGRTIAEIDATQDTIDAARTTRGHAVEVRLYAEDAEDGFLPATGRIELLRWPEGGHGGAEGVRVDAGIEVGSEIGPRFDPMLAKVVARGRDRAEAFERLTRALDDTVVLGLTTNLRFLRWLVRQPVLLDGQARIDTLDRIWPPTDWAERAAAPPEIWSMAARVLSKRVGPGDAMKQPVDPFAGGWRLNAAPSIRIATDAMDRTVSIGDPGAGSETDSPAFVEADDGVHIDLAGRSILFRVAPPPDVDRAGRAAAAHGHAGGPAMVSAPMPGTVLAVHVSLDASVAAGDPIVTLEAMKMEHVVVAPAEGRLTELLVRPADQVVRGQLLATVESAAR